MKTAEGTSSELSLINHQRSSSRVLDISGIYSIISCFLSCGAFNSLCQSSFALSDDVEPTSWLPGGIGNFSYRTVTAFQV